MIYGFASASDRLSETLDMDRGYMYDWQGLHGAERYCPLNQDRKLGHLPGSACLSEILAKTQVNYQSKLFLQNYDPISYG